MRTLKSTLAVGTMIMMTGALLAADSQPKDDVIAAARKLGEKSSYAWHSETVVPEGTQFRPGPVDGKTEKDGFTHISWTMFDSAIEIVRKGDKAAYTDRDGAWQLAEDQPEEGRGRWLASFARSMAAPAKQVADLVGDTQEIKSEAGMYSGNLTEAGAKSLMTFRRGAEGPSISNAKGTVKFWLKEGELTKYEYKVTGLMDWNGNEVEIDRSTTVEIKGVDSTKVEVPAEAKQKLGS